MPMKQVDTPGCLRIGWEGVEGAAWRSTNNMDQPTPDPYREKVNNPVTERNGRARIGCLERCAYTHGTYLDHDTLDEPRR